MQCINKMCDPSFLWNHTRLQRQTDKMSNGGVVWIIIRHFCLGKIVSTTCQVMEMKAHRSAAREVEAMVVLTEATEVRIAVAAGAVAACLEVGEEADLIVVLTVEAEVDQEEEEAWGKC